MWPVALGTPGSDCEAESGGDAATEGMESNCSQVGKVWAACCLGNGKTSSSWQDPGVVVPQCNAS